MLDDHEGEPLYPTLDRLDREWDEIATSPAATDALRRWAVTEPALGEHRDLAELLVTRTTNAHPRLRDPGALARWAAADPLAAGTDVAWVGVRTERDVLTSTGRGSRPSGSGTQQPSAGNA